MLWKELFIERVASLGRFGRWLGLLLTLAIGGGSLVLAGMMAYSALLCARFRHGHRGLRHLKVVLGGFAGTLLGWLLQWGVGLRAAVSIASERERGTWDALLMSPLVPSEIARGQARRQPLRAALDGRRHAAGLDPGGRWSEP